jgi:flagellar hook-associated protein 3 FlgL
MKTSFISSNAIQNAMRLTIRETQNQMSDASQEATTGVYADFGVSLGGQVSQSIDFNREISRIDSITGSNSIANSRLSASQDALTNMSSSAQSFLDQLIALRGNSTGSSIQLSQDTAKDTLSSTIDSANTMLNGQYIFSGINTDVQPMTDNTADATTAIQNNLQAYADLNAGGDITQLTGTQMTDFITNYVEPAFSGVAADPSPPTLPTPPATDMPDWTTWSSASDQNMTSRINNSEVVESSTNTNADGIRYLALASTVTQALMGMNLSGDAVNAVTDQSISYARQAIDGQNNQASLLGLSQSRVSKANDALSAQKDIINNNIVDLQGVDPYEASTKANALQTQLETAYTLVSKIQQLSLVNYL